MQQDNNIVKICVVNQDEDFSVTWLLLHDWSIFDYKCNFVFNARDISGRGAEKRVGGQVTAGPWASANEPGQQSQADALNSWLPCEYFVTLWLCVRGNGIIHRAHKTIQGDDCRPRRSSWFRFPWLTPIRNSFELRWLYCRSYFGQYVLSGAFP